MSPTPTDAGTTSAPPPPRPGTPPPPPTAPPAGGAAWSQPAPPYDAWTRPASAPPRESGISPLAEALGYAGGVLTTIATLYLAGDLWDQLGEPGRVVLLALATAGLGGAAGVVGSGDAIARRLSTTLWWLAGAAGTATSYLFADAVSALGADAGLLAAGTTAAAFAGSHWRRRAAAGDRGAALQTVTFLALLTAVFGGLGVLGGDDAARALAVWAAGAGWAAGAVAGVVRPHRTATALGALTAIAAAQVVLVDTRPIGLVLGLLTAAVATAAALPRRDALLGGFAALAGLVFVPQAVAHWFPTALTGTTLLLLAGLAMLGGCAGLVVAARRGATGS